MFRRAPPIPTAAAHPRYVWLFGLPHRVQGVDEAFDSAIRAEKEHKAALETYLQQQQRALGCNAIKYFHSRTNAKDRYQLEIPEKAAGSVPSSYASTTQRKGFRRFHTAEIQAMVADLIAAEDARDRAIKDTMRSMFEKFDKHRVAWSAASSAMATLDCLMSLALWSMDTSVGPKCRPRFSDAADPFLLIRGGWHACLASTMDGGFVPNDTVRGSVAWEGLMWGLLS